MADAVVEVIRDIFELERFVDMGVNVVDDLLEFRNSHRVGGESEDHRRRSEESGGGRLLKKFLHEELAEGAQLFREECAARDAVD